MTKRTIVVRRKNCAWQPKTKRKQASIETKSQEGRKAGFVNPVFVVAFFGLLAGLFYLYSINQSAIRGFQVKQAEKEIAEAEKGNEKLKIREAELKSLYHIEESAKQLNMSALGEVSYVDEGEAMALGKPAMVKK